MTMSVVSPEPGSFRDPSGRIYYSEGRVYRSVTAYGAADYAYVRDSGLIDRLSDAGRVIGTKSVSTDVLGAHGKDAAFVVEHPRIPFISYPYEWPFPALKAAALLHLDIQIEALESGISLSDATAYNIQFIGARPVFIDLLSFRQYRDGEIWSGHRQFCEQFLNPLLLRAKIGLSYNSWYRGSPEGIKASDVRKLLRWRSKLSLNVLAHVVAQAAFQHSSISKTDDKRSLATAKLPLQSYKRILSKLRAWIETLEPADSGKTVWQDYASSNSYNSDEAAQKKAFVGKFASATKPSVLWDIGCNSGDHTAVALKEGAGYCVGFDADHGALEHAFSRAGRDDMNFLPLLLDGANPTPSQGWNEQERGGLSARAKADGIIALAFVHHIAIGCNVPLDETVSWLIGLAPEGVIEFVPKQDPMVQELLALRQDIFPDYSEDTFLDSVRKRAEIIDVETVTGSGRKLIWFRRHEREERDAC